MRQDLDPILRVHTKIRTLIESHRAALEKLSIQNTDHSQSFIIDEEHNTILHCLAKELMHFLSYPREIETHLQLIGTCLADGVDFLYLNKRSESFLSILFDLTRAKEYVTHLEAPLKRNFGQWVLMYPDLLRNPADQRNWWDSVANRHKPFHAISLLISVGQDVTQPLDVNGNTLLHKFAEWSEKSHTARNYLNRYEQNYPQLHLLRNNFGESYLHVLINFNNSFERRDRHVQPYYARNISREVLLLKNASNLTALELAVHEHKYEPIFILLKLYLQNQTLTLEYDEVINKAWIEILNHRPITIQDILDLATFGLSLAVPIDEIQGNTLFHELLADSRDQISVFQKIVEFHINQGLKFGELLTIRNNSGLIPINYALSRSTTNYRHILWLIRSRFISVVARFSPERLTLMHALARLNRHVESVILADHLLLEHRPSASAKWQKTPDGYLWTSNYWFDKGVALMPISEALKQNPPNYLYAFKMIEFGSPACAKIGNDYLIHHLVGMTQDIPWIEMAIKVLIKNHNVSPNAQSALLRNKNLLQSLFLKSLPEQVLYRRGMLLSELGANIHHALDEEGNTLLHKMAVASAEGHITLEQLKKLIEIDVRCVFARNNSQLKALEVLKNLPRNTVTAQTISLVEEFDNPNRILYPKHKNHIPYGYFLGAWAVLIPLTLFNVITEGHLSITEGIQLPFWSCVILNILAVEVPLIYERMKKDYYRIQQSTGYGNPENNLLRVKLALNRYFNMLCDMVQVRVWGSHFSELNICFRLVSVGHLISHALAIYKSIYTAHDNLSSGFSRIFAVTGSLTLSIACTYTTSEDFFAYFNRSKKDTSQKRSSSLQSSSIPLMSSGDHHHREQHSSLHEVWNYTSVIWTVLSSVTAACIVTHFMELFYSSDANFEEESFSRKKPLDFFSLAILIFAFLISALYNQGALRKNTVATLEHSTKIITNVFHPRRLDLRVLPSSIAALMCLFVLGIGVTIHNLAHHCTKNISDWLDFASEETSEITVKIATLAFTIQSCLALIAESAERSYSFIDSHRDSIGGLFDVVSRRLRRIPEYAYNCVGFFSEPRSVPVIEDIELQNFNANNNRDSEDIRTVIAELKHQAQ